MPRLTIPEDRINLRLILVSGKTKDFLFRPSDSAGDIAQYVFDHWPQGKVLEGQRQVIVKSDYSGTFNDLIDVIKTYLETCFMNETAL